MEIIAFLHFVIEILMAAGVSTLLLFVIIYFLIQLDNKDLHDKAE
jgi:hypothetical protein